MEALSALKAWDGRANAWFLDGFSPATNPQMWRAEVLEQIAAHCAPGAMVATFTVAGAVRRGLAEQGFEVAKRPGFGRKHERLEAVWPGPAAPSPPPPRPARVAIIGAGIAGACLARAFAKLGAEATIFDQIGQGAGGSGNPAALVTPRLDLGDGASAHLYAQGFDHAVRSYALETPEAILDQGALQLEIHPTDLDRFDRLAALDLFQTDDLLRLTAAQASQHLGQAQERGGLMIKRALVLHPAAVLKAWLPKVNPAKIASLDREDGAWALRDANGAVIALADCVCIAAGAGTSALAIGLPLQIVRGQVSLAQGPVTTRPISASGYAIPMPGGVLFGATHDRDQTSTETRAIDNQRNLAQLSAIVPSLAAQIDPEALDARASLRAAGLDHLPVAGALEGQDGVFVLGGLGGRGFTLSPLLAEHIAAKALGHPSPLPHWVGLALEPSRFERRRLRRQTHP
jgi:tRNA 5-methylaminomethyl-2-thiouridine biosynthesis bifunctional protein